MLAHQESAAFTLHAVRIVLFVFLHVDSFNRAGVDVIFFKDKNYVWKNTQVCVDKTQNGSFFLSAVQNVPSHRT